VEEIMPTGLGLISGAPKIGKSWLVLQSALEIASGGELLGRYVIGARPVLYYALEDGERRLQSRLRQLIGNRNLDLSLLEFRLTAPNIGDGLEEEIAAWLDDNGQDGIVIIDVLSLIRPISRGRGSAYDEDYSVLKPLRLVLSARPSATIFVVTHDRKAGSDDWLTTVTGTRGVTGSVDWAWVVKRPRLKIEGIINVTGRDVNEQSIDASFTGAWVVSDGMLSARSPEQDFILDALRTEGDLTTVELVHFLFPESVDDPDVYESHRISTTKKLSKLHERGLVSKAPDPGHSGSGRPRALWHVMTAQEIADQFSDVKAASISAMPSHVRVTKRKRTLVDESA
jgi:hypothetical protein